MLTLYPSNKTESLAAIMAALIKAKPLSDPFAKETVLIQSQGMGTWLRQSLSEHLGVAALIDAPMPASFVWQLVTRLVPGSGVSPLFEKQTLRWEIYRRLPDLLEQEAFAPLKTYLDALGLESEGSESGRSKTEGVELESSDLDRFKVSEHLADSFDAYQNYRADWIESWERGDSALGHDTNVGRESAHVHNTERWQSALWQALYPGLDCDQRLHRPRQLQALRNVLTSGKVEGLPDRIFVFGLSALPPQWFELFLLLGRHIEIHFLAQNPCQYYWGDVQSERQILRFQRALLDKGLSLDSFDSSESFLETNPFLEPGLFLESSFFLENNALLASWGKLGKDYLSMLYRHDERDGLQEFFETLFDPWLDVDVNGNRNENGDNENSNAQSSALQCLQQDILELKTEHQVIDGTDQSLRFASCHSRLREVEALKDYLLTCLDDDPILGLKDIIVMMPDVQDYAPLIHAVFSESIETASGKTDYLDYAISDQSTKAGHAQIEFFVTLLSLPSLKITANEVMDWLNLDVVRERQGIAEEDLDILRQWFIYLNVRWGLSAQHRDQVANGTNPGTSSVNSINNNDRNTWLRAAQRLLRGHIYGEDLQSQQEGFAERSDIPPLPAVLQGREAQALLGALLRFLGIIESSLALLQGKRSGRDWLNIVRQLYLDWFDERNEYEGFRRQLEQILNAMEDQLVGADFEERVPFSLIASSLSNELEQARVSQRFLAGRINFCTLMPMRSIPFKVVCLLGMNEGDYPRPSQKSSFDLMALTPARQGDRSRRDDDRYLFLEALLSVRERFYISYIGRSVQDNSERYPSVLVSELQDYCARYFSISVANDQSNSVLLEGDEVLQYWTYSHRLQAFHPDYYRRAKFDENKLDENRLLHTYSTTFVFNADRFATVTHEPSSGSEPSSVSKQANVSEPGSVSKQGKETTPLEVAPERLALSRLASVLLQPLKHFYRSHGIEAAMIQQGMEDNEPFALGGLERHALKQDYLAARVSGQDDYAALQAWQRADLLPAAPFTQIETEQVSESVMPFVESLYQIEAVNTIDALVSVAFDNAQQHTESASNLPATVMVEAQFVHSAGALVDVSLSKIPASALFTLWIRHVFWLLYRYQSGMVVDINCQSRLMTSTKTWVLPLLSHEQAKAYAAALLEDFYLTQSQALCFLPKTAYAQIFESEAKAKTAFFGTHSMRFQLSGEIEDFYWQRAQQLGASPLPMDDLGMPDMRGRALYQQLSAVAQEIKELSE